MRPRYPNSFHLDNASHLVPVDRRKVFDNRVVTTASFDRRTDFELLRLFAEAAPEVPVGPVATDEGTLGIGKLGAPQDRYSACVQKNGGLSGKTGEVSVRFLVRAKGVAEGVSVAKRTNMSKEAAQCVAEVIDRRRVGTPESQMVGATVLVKFAKVDKLAK